MKPAILLDVDGVLSPWPTRGSKYWGDWEKGPECGFHLYLSKNLADALHTLPAEIFWLTTWEGMANEVLAPYFGWEEKKVIDRTGHDRFGSSWWWKLSAAQQWVEENPGRPFAWIDDDHFAHSTEWTKSLDVPTFVLPTVTDVGITPSQFLALDEFLQTYQDWCHTCNGPCVNEDVVLDEDPPWV